MVTQKELEKRLTTYADGALFIRPMQLAKAMNQSKTDHVRKYTARAFKPAGSTAYYIPDVARAIFESGDYSR